MQLQGKSIAASAVGIAFALWFGGCSASSGNPTVDDSIHQFLSPALIDTLKAHGMVFNDGSTPPNLEGFFFANALIRKGSNIPFDNTTTFANMSMKLSGQSGQRIDVDYNQSNIEVGGGSEAYVTGADSLFTIYIPIKGKYVYLTDTVQYESAFCYSGRMTDAGLTDFIYSLLITKKAADPKGIMALVGQGRVIVESDSLAARVTDYPHVGTAKRAATSSLSASSAP